MVDVVVVLLVLHHQSQVVVVGYGEGYGVGVGLAEIGLRIVGHVVLVLIPVERCHVVVVGLSVHVLVGIVLVGEDFPSRAGHLEGAGRDGRNLHADGGAGEHYGRLCEFADVGHTRLEVDVDVEDVAFDHRCEVQTRLVGLAVVILIYDGEDLFLAEVVDVRLACHVERTLLLRCRTIDEEHVFSVTVLL